MSHRGAPSSVRASGKFIISLVAAFVVLVLLLPASSVSYQKNENYTADTKVVSEISPVVPAGVLRYINVTITNTQGVSTSSAYNQVIQIVPRFRNTRLPI